MKVLSNLLTVLAALLNLASGCGLRGRGASQGLLQLGSVVAPQLLSGVSSGGTLATVGTVLGGRSSGRLLSRLTSLRGETLGVGLTSGTSGLGSSSANSGLDALGVLSNRLGGTSGGALLTGMGKIAMNHLSGAVSSGSIASGSNTAISGGNSGILVQGVQQSGQALASGFLATATSARSSTTSVGLRTGENTGRNLLGLVATPGGGHPGGVPSIPGGQPAFGGQGTEGISGSPGAVPGAGQAVPTPGSLGGFPGVALHGGVSSSRSVSASSISVSGGNSMHVLGQPLQQNRPEVGGGSPGTGGIATQLTAVSTAHYVGNTVQNADIASSPNGRGSGGILPSEVGAMDSPRPGLATLPGTRPAAGVPGGSGIGGTATGILNDGGSSGVVVPGSSNTISEIGLLGVQGLGQSTHQNGQRLGAAVLRGATSTLRTTSTLGAQMADRSTRTLLGVVPGPTSGVPGGVSPAGNMEPETGVLGVQGLGHSTHQNGQRLGAAVLRGATSTLRTTSALGAQMADGSTRTLLGVAPSPTGGAPGGVSPAGNMEPETGLLGVQGLGQGIHQHGQQLGAAISTVATSIRRTTSAMGSQMAGRSTATLLGVGPSPTGGVPVGVSPGGNMGPGNLPGQGLGQGADQASQSIGRTYIGGASTIQQSTTRLGTQLQGSFPGGRPGQGPLQATQPGHVPGGVSRVTVSASTQSSSSWRSQTHVVSGSAGNVVAGLPSLGGPGPGVGVPIGAPGSGSAGAGAGTGSALLHAIVGAASAGRPQGGPGPSVQGGLGVISSSGIGSGSLSSGVVSGVAHTVQKPHRRGPSAAAAAGLALGTVASALALTAIGTGLASALHNGAAGGGRRIGGCSGGGGCGSGCGRRKRSVPSSKVPAEVLNEIPSFLETLFKPAGNKSKSALGGAFGTGLGQGILNGLLGGMKRASAGEKVDPGLQSVLASFGREFSEDTTVASSGGTGTEAGSATTTAGSGGAAREPDSSEEKNKGSGTNAGGAGTTKSSPEKPASPTAGESGSETPGHSPQGQPGSETSTKPAPAVTGPAGSPGTDVVKNVGAAAGAAIATTLLGAIFEAIKKKKEKKKKAQGGAEQTVARRERRSLADALGTMGTKGLTKGMNAEPDLSNSFYCGRHEMPNTVGARDRFCHPSATWNTTMRLLPDCVCQPGFLRNSWGECISARECNQCRSKHRFNMDYHVCGSQCPIVCNQPVNEYCPTTCVRKCACRPGYIRKYPNGPCVTIKQCLPACRGRNQIFSLCSSLCPPTCRRPIPKRCPKICAGEGCVCKPGFVVKKWEPLICVRPERCPGRRRKCKGPNQVYTRCRRRCAPSCFTRRHRYCGKGCIGRGCVCKRGFVVLQWRPLVCVRRNQCPARRKKCPAKNQIYKYCKSKCPPTCADKKPRKCGSACAGEGCACKPGFVIKQQKPLVCVRRFRCRSIKKRPNRGNGRRVPHPDDLLPWSSMPN